MTPASCRLRAPAAASGALCCGRGHRRCCPAHPVHSTGTCTGPHLTAGHRWESVTHGIPLQLPLSLLQIKSIQVSTARDAVSKLLAVQAAQSADAGTGAQCEQQIIADSCAALPALPAGIRAGSHLSHKASAQIATGSGSCETSMQHITKPTALLPVHAEGSYTCFTDRHC